MRHEAAEALGAIGTRECLAALAAAAADPCPVVSQTCLLALQRIQHYAAAPAAATVCNGAIRSDTAEPSAGAAAAGPTGPGGAAGGSGAGEPSAGRDEAHQAACDGPVPNGAARYTSVDPAPAAPAGTPVAALRAALLDEDAPIFERYRALFGLRNAGGPAAVAALGAAFAGRSALLKHEVAYVLGQMQDAAAVDTLRCAALSALAVFSATLLWMLLACCTLKVQGRIAELEDAFTSLPHTSLLSPHTCAPLELCLGWLA